tara:strand:+ start:105292 stop:105906 length:615 start_codon:yes stop_codon:yes gene_type:complete
MSGIIGKKIGMTSIFLDGKNIPCTLIEAGPCSVTQIKTVEKDGYSSIQLGFDLAKLKNTTKSKTGHLKKSNSEIKKKFKEFSWSNSTLKLGDTVNVDHFSEGEYVDISGISKGKGFQGVVKRHGFAGVGQSTHGQHNRLRAPGSIGAASYPARVFKGMRMAGQTGNKKVKVINLMVLKVVPEDNLILIKGCVPGPKNSYVIIQK